MSWSDAKAARNLQKLDAANIIEGAGAMSEREKLLARVKYDPESFIHHTIYQTFDGIVYEGVVTAVDVDRRSMTRLESV